MSPQPHAVKILSYNRTMLATRWLIQFSYNALSDNYLPPPWWDEFKQWLDENTLNDVKMINGMYPMADFASRDDALLCYMRFS